MSKDRLLEWEGQGRCDLPVFASYFTDLFYLREAYELVRSLQAHGLSYYVAEVPDLGSWQENTNFKPTWLQHVSFRYATRPIVWLDADARVRRTPGLFAACHSLVAYHVWEGHKPASGTVYVGSQPGRDLFLQRWAWEVERDPGATDQVCMARAVKNCGVTFQELPRSYCSIFDCEGVRLDTDPVIEHMQASRWATRQVPYIKKYPEAPQRKITSKR